MSLPNLTSHSQAADPSSFAISANSGHSPSDPAAGFVDRRSMAERKPAHSERRQFGSSHFGLSDDGRELALAIDQYKVQHHRRYLTCDEMLTVLSNLGYSK